MKVAIVHDDLVQWGGAERVLEGICEIFPEANIFTSVFDENNKELKKRFAGKVKTSFLQEIPGWKNLYKALLPLYPIAFEQFDFSKYDLVISQTTRFAKVIITKPETTHICYCHTPPRFLWNFSGEKYKWLEFYLKFLRRFDKVSSSRADYFLAGSKNAKERIKQIYGKDSKVVYPFIDLQRFVDIESFDGGYYLIIARLNEYKRIDLAVRACVELGVPLKVIGDGPELKSLQTYVDRHKNVNIDFLGNLSDQMVVKVLAGCRALIIPGIEDFGLTALEAQALGKPVIAYKKGGVLETVIEHQTGLFFSEQTVEDLKSVLMVLKTANFNPGICQKNAHHFSKEIFMKNFKQAVEELV